MAAELAEQSSQDAAPVAVAATRKTPWLWIAAVVIALVVGGGVVYFVTRPAALPSFDVHGSLAAADLFAVNTATAGGSCTAPAGDSDIAAGTQVLITNASGKTVGLGELGAGAYPTGLVLPVCDFPFTVTGIPGGQGPYSIAIGDHGKVAFDQKDAGDLEINLG